MLFMDIFQSEQARVEKRIDEVVSQLQDIGLRGQFINKKLYTLRNALKYPDHARRSVLELGESEKESNDSFAEIKAELLAYAEKSSILIQDLTKILTEIRYTLVYSILISGTIQ
jgi:hypothetical protein